MYREGLRSSDIVHGLGDSFVVTAASLWARLLSRTLVREMTVYSTGRAHGTLRSLVNRFRYYALNDFTYRRADLLVSINRLITAYFEGLGIGTERIWQRPNPVDQTVYRPAGPDRRRRARASLGFGDDDRVLVTIGAFIPRKNQKFLVRVMKQLPRRFKCVLVGPVSNDDARRYSDELGEEIRLGGLEDRFVVFAGHEPDVRPFYDAADTLLVPSTSEGTPNVMLEALSSGVPVVANQELGLDTFLGDGRNGYNVELSHAAFAERILRLERMLEDPGTRAAIAADARREFGSDRIDREHIARLARALGNRRGGGGTIVQAPSGGNRESVALGLEPVGGRGPDQTWTRD
jgi:glycosyltransferase involved in cell wall biosynthesis